MTLPDTTDVLVVGAGPTGLTLALALATRGVSCAVIDALAAGGPQALRHRLPAAAVTRSLGPG